MSSCAVAFNGIGGALRKLEKNAIKFFKEAIKTGHDQQCGEEELLEAYRGLNELCVRR